MSHGTRVDTELLFRISLGEVQNFVANVQKGMSVHVVDIVWDVQ